MTKLLIPKSSALSCNAPLRPFLQKHVNEKLLYLARIQHA